MLLETLKQTPRSVGMQCMSIRLSDSIRLSEAYTRVYFQPFYGQNTQQKHVRRTYTYYTYIAYIVYIRQGQPYTYDNIVVET